MRKKFKRKFYRLNFNIPAPELRVIDEKGKQIGILSKEKALQLAREKEIDLVEVVPHASPPVCKLIDFKKFSYLEKKKHKEQRKKEKGSDVKEIRFRPFIANHDYQVRLNQVKEFLKKGEKVKVAIHFFGREIAKKQFGFEIIKKLLKDLGDKAILEKQPRFLGETLVAQVSPDKKYGQKEKQTSRPVGQGKQAKSKNQKDS